MSSRKRITAYRIFKSRFASSWKDGEGAFRYGGRWNSPGRRVLYGAENLAQAALEMLVHLQNEQLLLSYSYATLEFPEKLVTDVGDFIDLPSDWNSSPPPLSTQRIGDEWYDSSASAVLRVPAVVVPIGHNYIFNTTHPDFSKVVAGEPQEFAFDRRLTS